MDCSPPSSSVHGILQARLLEWVAISFSKGSFQPKDRTWVSFIVHRFFTAWATEKALPQGRYRAKAKWNKTMKDFVNLSRLCFPKASVHRRIQRSRGAGEDPHPGETGDGPFLLQSHEVTSGWGKETEAGASGPGPERRGSRVRMDGTRARHGLEAPLAPVDNWCCSCVCVKGL